ncbi:TonB-dependent receptor [Chitinophaga japonensis]|uniref:Outer membrane receptor protein involved in Fe transport n=1 Tax=Chitinophaga japonensis TaxID=104662 RepID=A0A562TFJ0_CHIJA|nr:TonB-dependent receptor [Chitinophaga japonensis]TWI92265.1 outer membrane receptor protein involved in Fe transport [Chitinophaga japonensis]
MWKRYGHLVAFLCLPALLAAQHKISGRITDARKRPLPGVNIYIKGTYDGATAAADGSFSFTTTAAGQQVLVGSLMGYQTLEQPVTISGPLQLTLMLKASISELKAVTISAGSVEASNDRQNTVLKPLDIVTTAGATADIVNAIKTLPGAQQTNDREGLFVRGGTGYETQIFIDGLLVRNPFFTSLPDMPGRGRFSPFLFKGTTFSSGGYSAQYGQGLSSALVLESEDLPTQSSYSLGASLIGISGGLDELMKDKKGSYGIEADYTNLAPYFDVAKPNQQPTTGPEILGTSLNFRRKTSATGMVKFYGYGNWSRMGFRKNSIEYPGYHEEFDVRNQNIYTNLTYKESLGNGWRLNSGFSFSTNRDKIRTDTIEKTTPAYIRSLSNLSQARLMVTKALGVLSVLRLGGEYQYAVESSSFNAYEADYVDNYSAAFAETDVYFTPRFVGRFGGRMEYTSILAKMSLAPRVSLAYKLNDHSQFSVAYGDYYQKPEPQYLRFNRSLGYMKATHYIASFQRIAGDYTFRMEAFYKKYRDLVKTVPDTSTTGTGYARGIELFWRDRKTIKNLDYWVSYSYLDTKRNYLYYPYEVQPDFAAKHTASLVVKKYFPGITTNIGATYSFASGRPYYNPNLPESKFMSERTIDYNTLGLSASYLTTIGRAFTVFVLSVTNVLDIKQVYGYRYSSDKLRREEIVPNAPRFLFVGMFMNFGIDRRQDVINNL